MLDPSAALARNPTARQIKHIALTSEGPNEVWCCNGHDKLTKYGFVIWGIRDKFSRKWLGLWVVLNNRIGIVVAYLWLTVVRDLGGKYQIGAPFVWDCYLILSLGIPKQTSSDCRTENTIICGFANALRLSYTLIMSNYVVNFK